MIDERQDHIDEMVEHAFLSSDQTEEDLGYARYTTIRYWIAELQHSIAELQRSVEELKKIK